MTSIGTANPNEIKKKIKLRFSEYYRISNQLCLYFRDGRLRVGDELLMVNGKLLVGLTHQEAVATLRSTAGLIQLVVASMVRTLSPSSYVHLHNNSNNK